eukprot:2380624-Pyramimonas_sp.AAC.1
MDEVSRGGSGLSGEGYEGGRSRRRRPVPLPLVPLAYEARRMTERTGRVRRTSQARTLMEQKYALDTKVSELSAKLGTASGELSAAQQEVERLRAENTKLDAQAHEREKKQNASLVQLSSLQQQVKDK